MAEYPLTLVNVKLTVNKGREPLPKVRHG